MCLDPIKLNNKALKYHPGLLQLTVPCGKCSECQEVKSTDYFVRTWALYEDLVLHSGWSAFFVTLTFAPEFLPTVEFGELSFHDEKVFLRLTSKKPQPCFNHQLLKTFLKSFAQYYRRRELAKPQVLITCEYGEKRHRPHYHGVFIVPEKISFKEFQKVLHRFWVYGFTSSFDFKLLDGKHDKRSPVNCIKYAVKYANKGNSWQPPFMELIGTNVCPIGREWYDIVPRIFTTNGFGASLEKRLTKENYEKNSISFVIDGKLQTFTIPAYYRRRYFTEDVIDSQEVVTEKIVRIYKQNNQYLVEYDFLDKIKRKSHTVYKNDYLDVRRTQLIDQVGKDFFDAHLVYCSRTPAFQLYLDSNGYDYDDLLFCFRSGSKKKYQDMFIHYMWCNSPFSDTEHNEIIDAEYLDFSFEGKKLYSVLWFQNTLRAVEIVKEFKSYCRERKRDIKFKQELAFYKEHNLRKFSDFDEK